MGVFKGCPTSLGDHHGLVKQKFYNRTGATLNRGEVAMEDWLDTQAEVTSTSPGNEDGIFANLTPVTQASLEEGFPIVVCLDATVADNAVGNFLVYGYCEQTLVLKDDTSTADIDKGDRISMLVSESAIAVQAFATGAAAGNRTLGIALEDAATGAGSSLKKTFWTGGVPVLGSSDT